MEQRYQVRSGRRSLGVRTAPTAQIALLEHARSLGCRDEEIMKLGIDSIAWRGAVFRAVRVPPDAPEPSS
jgi:hypothetical protein